MQTLIIQTNAKTTSFYSQVINVNLIHRFLFVFQGQVETRCDVSEIFIRLQCLKIFFNFNTESFIKNCIEVQKINAFAL